LHESTVMKTTSFLMATTSLTRPSGAGRGRFSTDEGLVIQSPCGLSERSRYWIPACAGMTSKGTQG
jgi:hypothetical protein